MDPDYYINNSRALVAKWSQIDHPKWYCRGSKARPCFDIGRGKVGVVLDAVLESLGVR